MEQTFEFNEGEKLSSLLRVSFRFEPHHGREQYRTDQVQQMKGIFNKNQRNLLFLEGVSDDYVGSDNWMEGFNKYPKGTRFISAYAYACLRREGVPSEKITHERISDFTSRIFNGEPSMGQYIARKMMAADELELDGYKIEPLLEEPMDEEINSKSKVGSNATKALNNLASASNSEVKDLSTQIHSRNQKIIKQLEEVGGQAENTDIKTNVYVSLGTVHNTLVVDLPENLKECVVAASTNDEKVPVAGRLYEKLYEKSESENKKSRSGFLSRMIPRFKQNPKS